jgi:putative ABC transport system ATP-binding protein
MELAGTETKEARRRAEQLLTRVGITAEQIKRFPANLSGGEQQRVAIARSLASGAKIILADEPTGNLDAENTGNIMDILESLAREDGYCVVIVTHDMEVAEKADVVYRMTDGVVE